MYQLVSVYLKKECFLLHPSSMIGERGLWVASQPGVGVSTTASDEVIGQLVMLIRAHSKHGLPKQDLRQPVPFPLASIAGVQSWGALARSSPVMVSVKFDDLGITITKNTRDGQGYSEERSSEFVLPPGTSAQELGASVRRAFADLA